MSGWQPVPLKITATSLMDSENILKIVNARAFPVSDALQRSPAVVRNEQGLLGRFPRSDALHRSPDVVRNGQGLLGRPPGSDAPQQRPVVTKSQQRFPCLYGRGLGKKVISKRKVRFASWNVGTLSGKSMEVVDVMRRRKINIACLQETRWKEEKLKRLMNSNYGI